MGDILHALPAVTALRLAHPSWEIDWVVEPRWKALLSVEGGASGGPRAAGRRSALLCAHQSLAAKPFSLKTTHEINALRRQLRSNLYNAVLDLQGAIRSAVVGRMAGCPRLIGEAAPREAAARLLFTERVATSGAHVIEQDLELASAVAGDPLTHVAPLLPVDPAAEAWCDAFLASSGTRPVALINPGADGAPSDGRWSALRLLPAASACGASVFWSMQARGRSQWPTPL